MRRIPSLASIEAFTAAMRAATFKDAAADLALSPSSFSRRIAHFETHVGKPLFRRRGGHMVPSEDARLLSAELAPLLEQIRNATAMAGHRPDAARLRVLVAPSLAAEWLLPRLAQGLTHAAIGDPCIDVGGPGAGLDGARHDLAILVRRSEERDAHAETLAPVEAVVVAAPVLADNRRPPETPDDVGRFDRLDLRFPEGLWRLWSERSGAPMPRDRHMSRFPSLTTVYEAAAAGFGVALGVPLLSESRMQEGRLKPCFRGVTPLGFDYRLVYRNARTQRRTDVRRLADWLHGEVNSARDEFRALAA